MKTFIDSYGSFVTHGPRYSVLQCRGPVRYRQTLASERKVICYAEAHLNAVTSQQLQYGFCVTGKTTPPKTDVWAREYLRLIGEAFGITTNGLLKGGVGSGNVQWVSWPTPTMLLEPLFISQPEMAERVVTGEGLDALGRCLADSINACFPDGGLVGLSIGHAYRGTGDKGAHVAAFDLDEDGVSDLDPKFDQEAELCEVYVDSATEILTGVQT